MSRLGVRQPLRWAVILLAVAAIGLAGALVGIGDGGTTSHHGGTGRLHGTVMRGPTTPVCRQGTPCSQPASGARLIFKRHGRVATSVVVAKDGSYSVRLAAGVYTVAVSPQSPVGRGIDPGAVRVTARRTRDVDFSIDTGIR